MKKFGASKGEIMAKRTFFAIVCVVLSVHATAWGQGPGYAPGSVWSACRTLGWWARCKRHTSRDRCNRSDPPGHAAGTDASRGPCSRAHASRARRRAIRAVRAAVLVLRNQGIPQWEAFGDFLYMRPRSANVAYGVVFNGSVDGAAPTAATPIQLAEPGTASIDFHPGFRVGFAKSLDECNAVVATFTHYEGEDQNSISTDQFLIRSMVSQPATWSSNAASDWLSAASDYT